MSSAPYLALGIESCGPPEFIKVLNISSTSVFTSNSVLIKVHAVAANRVDIMKRMMPFFSLPPSPSAPQILGWDGAGIIEKVGENVEKFKTKKFFNKAWCIFFLSSFPFKRDFFSLFFIF